MSVLIKGMDMPKEGKIIVIYKLNGQIYASMNGTELCPLVEIPTPHGRLIDVNALKTDTEYDLYLDDFTSYTKRQIDLAPTVIEAEE